MRCKGEAWRAGGESRHEVDGIDEYILVLDVHYILIYICMYIYISILIFFDEIDEWRGIDQWID